MVALNQNAQEFKQIRKNSLNIEELSFVDPTFFVNGNILTEDDLREIKDPEQTKWAISLLDSLSLSHQEFLYRTIGFQNIKHYMERQKKWLERFCELEVYRLGRSINLNELCLHYSGLSNEENPNSPIQGRRYRIFYSLMYPENCKILPNLDTHSKEAIDIFAKTADKTAEKNYQTYSVPGLIEHQQKKVSTVGRLNWQYEPCYQSLWLERQ